STRPGSARVSAAEEQRRVLDVVAGLAEAGVWVSVDTLHASTAAAAIAAGARLINDVSGGLADPEMLAAVAASDAEYAIGHWRGIPDPEHSRAQYREVLADVTAELAERVAAARAAGIPAERLILDPGLGFDKTTEQGWRLLAGFPELGRELGLPVLIGVSRKRMLAELLPAGHPVTDRDLPTAVVSALAARSGAWGVRVHDVAGTRAALAVQSAWDGSRPERAAVPGTESR
ncbi:dihydropteroate synthase, partial [Leucobacter sp. M11]|uniref:dihydropteroate synthase n=1 Tax=Leucobacter sp. M11 TaxID=2993565 RepID=UPI002D7ED0AC